MNLYENKDFIKALFVSSSSPSLLLQRGFVALLSVSETSFPQRVEAEGRISHFHTQYDLGGRTWRDTSKVKDMKNCRKKASPHCQIVLFKL